MGLLEKFLKRIQGPSSQLIDQPAFVGAVVDHDGGLLVGLGEVFEGLKHLLEVLGRERGRFVVVVAVFVLLLLVFREL